MINKTLIAFFISNIFYLFMGCNESVEATKGNKIVTEVNQTKPELFLSKYVVDKYGNILDKDGNILDTQATVDKNKNIVDNKGQIIDRFGNLLDENGLIIGIYVPPTRSELDKAFDEYGLNTIEHEGGKNVYIDGVLYNIESTLRTATDRNIGISKSVNSNFFGTNEEKKFVFSPEKYVAIIRTDIEPSLFFSQYDGLHVVSVIMSINDVFTFDGESIIYKSPVGSGECSAFTGEPLVVSIFVGFSQVGLFRLRCEIETGELFSLQQSTQFSGIYDKELEVKIKGIERRFIIKIQPKPIEKPRPVVQPQTNNECDDLIDPYAPPQPSECLLQKFD